jgi:predicted nucleic acid-binding protein
MDKSLIFFDSNVLIAATIKHHVHHAAASARLKPLLRGGGALAAHSLAEIYNTLTKQGGYRLPPLDAAYIVQDASKTYRVITLTAMESIKAIEDAATHGLKGPIIYDALLLACARKVNAKVIYTSNTKHFCMVAPDLASRIREP